MFGWITKKAAQQSLFNVELNTRTLIAIANRAYPDHPDNSAEPVSDEIYRAGTEKVLKAQRNLLQDILLALDNGAPVDEVRARIEQAKTKEAIITLGAKMAVATVIDEVENAIDNGGDHA